METEEGVILMEAKSGETAGGDFFDAMAKAAPLIERAAAPRKLTRLVVYGGGTAQTRAGARVVPWSKLRAVDWL